MTPEDSLDQRVEPSRAGDELTLLVQFLDYHRATFARKTDGISQAQSRRRLEASSLSLAGLTSHLALVENQWFHQVARGLDPSEPWANVDWRATPDADFDLGDTEPFSELQDMWRAACERSRRDLAQVIESADGDPLDVVVPINDRRGHVSLRWILIHMIEEYARHNGHADLLRESIDGVVGE